MSSQQPSKDEVNDDRGPRDATASTGDAGAAASPAERLRSNRRTLLAGAGSLSLAGFLAACGVRSSSGETSGSSSATVSAAQSSASSAPLAAADRAALTTLIDKTPACPMTKDVTEGPYWFDVNYIRSDISEGKSGLPLELGLQVVDLDGCTPAGGGNPVRDAVVEIWHCDALGVYSGFESGSRSANNAAGGPGGPGGGGTPPSGPPPGGGGGDNFGAATGNLSDGQYSEGDPQSETTDDNTYLRGAQPTDENGFVHFTTVYPGWYTGRTVHIHCRVHIDKKTALTSQIYFDDALNDSIFSGVSPYNTHTGRDTRNDTDTIYDATGLSAAERQGDKVYAGLKLGVSDSAS